MKNDIPFTGGSVVFRNSQGLRAQGSLIRPTRTEIVFEVYNPFSIVQLSEVLTDVQIWRGERTIYSGRASVTNLINTGLVLVVSASLQDPWSDVVELAPGPQLRDEVQRFVDDWSRSSRQLRPGYVNAVSRLRNFLEEFSRWLDHGETLTGLAEQGNHCERRRQFAADVEAKSAQQMTDLFSEFEEQARLVEEPALSIHKAFVRRETHPLIMCSPFTHRCYTKPLGYAGDYEMVNMMAREPWEGSSAYAQVLNAFFLNTPTVLAHRQRIDELLTYLQTEVQRAATNGRTCRILNVGCGPAVEIQRFVASSPLADDAEIELVDFSQESLDYAQSEIARAIQTHGRRTSVKYTHRSVHELLKQASRRGEQNWPGFDLVYCAGLFDYLSDRVCQKLLQLFYALTLEGGAVVATNVHTSNPVRCCMEHLQEWYLILRSEEQMLQLVPKLGQQRTWLEQTGVNVFLEIRKPAAVIKAHDPQV